MNINLAIIQAELQNIETRLNRLENSDVVEDDAEAYCQEALTAVAALRVAVEDDPENQ
jgi:hypothetical protein